MKEQNSWKGVSGSEAEWGACDAHQRHLRKRAFAGARRGQHGGIVGRRLHTAVVSHVTYCSSKKQHVCNMPAYRGVVRIPVTIREISGIADA